MHYLGKSRMTRLVAQSFSLLIFTMTGCDAKRYQESFKCPYHKVQPSVKDQEKQKTKKPYAYQDIPNMLQLYTTNTPNGERTGVRTVMQLPAGAWIGPYEGKLVKKDEVPMKNNFMWEVNNLIYLFTKQYNEIRNKHHFENIQFNTYRMTDGYHVREVLKQHIFMAYRHFLNDFKSFVDFPRWQSAWLHRRQ